MWQKTWSKMPNGLGNLPALYTQQHQIGHSNGSNIICDPIGTNGKVTLPTLDQQTIFMYCFKMFSPGQKCDMMVGKCQLTAKITTDSPDAINKNIQNICFNG